MATVGKVSAVFTASTSGLKSGVADAQSSFKKLQNDVAGLRGGLTRLTAISGAQLFGSIASGVSSAARSFLSMAGAESEVIDNTSKLARRLGMTYGELSGLALAGNLAGVSMDTIGKAATKADIAFVKASQGSSVAQAAFAGIGLSVDQLQNKSPAERFQLITDAIAGLPTAAERARASVALFGKSGAELLPMFEGGAGGIRAATEEAERFGLALTNEQGQSVENMNDAFTRAYSAISGVVQQVVAYLAPALQAVTDTFSNLIGGIGGANIGQFIGDGILRGAEYFAGIADYFVSNASGLWEYASQVGAQWNGVWEFANRAAAFFAGVGDAFKAGLAAAMLGIVAPFALIINGIKEAAGMLGYESKALNSAAAGINAFGQSLGNDMEKSAASAKKNFAYALTGEGGPKNEAGQAVRGPLATSLSDAIRKAREDAAATNVSQPQTVGVKPPAAETVAEAGPSSEALKATDSRSKEGIAEMFRLMRGRGDDVQDKQLAVLESIDDKMSEETMENVMEFAGG